MMKVPSIACSIMSRKDGVYSTRLPTIRLLIPEEELPKRKSVAATTALMEGVNDLVARMATTALPRPILGRNSRTMETLLVEEEVVPLLKEGTRMAAIRMQVTVGVGADLRGVEVAAAEGATQTMAAMEVVVVVEEVVDALLEEEEEDRRTATPTLALASLAPTRIVKPEMISSTVSRPRSTSPTCRPGMGETSSPISVESPERQLWAK